MTATDRGRSDLNDGTRLRQIVNQRTRASTTSVEPSSAFEAVTRQMVVDLRVEIQAVRSRIDSLFGVVVGSVLLDLLMRLAGWR